MINIQPIFKKTGFADEVDWKSLIGLGNEMGKGLKQSRINEALQKAINRGPELEQKIAQLQLDKTNALNEYNNLNAGIEPITDLESYNKAQLMNQGGKKGYNPLEQPTEEELYAQGNNTIGDKYGNVYPDGNVPNQELGNQLWQQYESGANVPSPTEESFVNPPQNIDYAQNISSKYDKEIESLRGQIPDSYLDTLMQARNSLAADFGYNEFGDEIKMYQNLYNEGKKLQIAEGKAKDENFMTPQQKKDFDVMEKNAQWAKEAENNALRLLANGDISKPELNRQLQDINNRFRKVSYDAERRLVESGFGQFNGYSLYNNQSTGLGEPVNGNASSYQLGQLGPKEKLLKDAPANFDSKYKNKNIGMKEVNEYLGDSFNEFTGEQKQALIDAHNNKLSADTDRSQQLAQMTEAQKQYRRNEWNQARTDSNIDALYDDYRKAKNRQSGYNTLALVNPKSAAYAGAKEFVGAVVGTDFAGLTGYGMDDGMIRRFKTWFTAGNIGFDTKTAEIINKAILEKLKDMENDYKSAYNRLKEQGFEEELKSYASVGKSKNKSSKGRLSR